MKLCQFWGREFMSLSQKYEERVRKLSFLARHHFKAEWYGYIYIVIFGKHLSELYLIVLMCFYILNTLLVRKTSNIKPWTGHLPPPIPHPFVPTYKEFAKLRVSRAFMPYAPSRLRALSVFMPSCLTHLCAIAPYVSYSRALSTRLARLICAC